MDSLRSDLRHACRRLLASPGFAAIATLSIALGVGASTAVVGAVRAVLFAALPYPQAHRVVALTDRGSQNSRLPTTYGTYLEVAARSRSFERLAVADRWEPALVVPGGDPERLTGDRVSADYFRVLGVGPAFGRDFDAADDQPGGPLVAVVSSGLAARRFGGGEKILGSSIVLDSVAYTVIGVMPTDFRNALAPAAEVWSPRQYRAGTDFQGPEWGHHQRMVGRLVAGVSAAQAEREIESIGRAPVAEFPRPAWATLERGLIVESIQDSMTTGVRPALLAILGAVFLLLVVACVNVSNLLLTRALARRAELAVRTALGAGRARLARQLVTESLLIALLGGFAAVGVAVAVDRVLVSFAPAELMRTGVLRLDASVFVIALAVSTIVGLVAGVVPGLRGVQARTYVAVRAGSQSADAGHQFMRRTLVVTQVAVAFVLLASTALLYRSVDGLLATAPGFDGEGVLTLQVVATGRRYDSPADLAQFYERTLDAVRGLPGVVDAASTSQLPLSGESDIYGIALESEPRANDQSAGAAQRYAVTADWFRTMRIPLVDGRVLGADDRPDAPQAVLINESFAKRRFGSRSAIGQRLRMGPYLSRPDGPWATIVGVVGDVKQTSLALDSPDAVYFAMGQWAWVDVVQSIAIRTRTDPAALAPSVERAIWSVDPTPPLVRVTTMKELVAASEAQRSFALVVFAAFALTAVVLAIVGLYGVVARSVEERERELGVRAALGASPRRVAALVVRQGMTLVSIGILLGALGAAGVTGGLSSLLFGVSPLDGLTFGATVVCLAGVSLLACGIPAARAARVDPAIALRSE